MYFAGQIVQLHGTPSLKPLDQPPAQCSFKAGQEAPAAYPPEAQGKHADSWAPPQIHASELEWKGVF